ncbi:hypothetical protein VO56_02225 [Mycoplasmopsis gallinacea]|uniref:DNA methyltransferase n=1 Tax=Mycoplasmopsis gallinacea TaxID=29556 RepID=A0A0D5ZK81_9BACT|nr:hypothetical protein VO56_02225 [Mycoplasmopsis gallinacea]
MKRKKKVVWALFDTPKRDVYQVMKDKFDVYSINEYKCGKECLKECKNHILINQFTNWEKALSVLPKPDIIWASPPSNAWSQADTDMRFVNNIFNKGTKTLFEFNNFKHYKSGDISKFKKRDPMKKMSSFIDCLTKAQMTIEIINKYKTSKYIIENPETSLFWELLKMMDFGNKSHKTKTYYSSYSPNFSSKPTIYLSSIKLELQGKKEKASLMWNDLEEKSRLLIPQKLIQDISNQLEA